MRSSLVALIVMAGAAAMALTACAGGGNSAGGTDPTPPPISTVVPEPQGGPLPRVSPQQVKNLVGLWTNTTKNIVKDSFTFKSDGTGSWDMQGKTLWRGQVIPLGRDAFRLSWRGKDPSVASYWEVSIGSDGKLLFQGNQATYAKGRSA